MARSPQSFSRGVIPLAGTRARSRNNGNRLNKYLPFPPSGEHTLRSGLPFIPGRKVTILQEIQCINAAESPIIKLSYLRASSNRRMSDLALEARTSIVVGNAPAISAFFFAIDGIDWCYLRIFNVN